MWNYNINSFVYIIYYNKGTKRAQGMEDNLTDILDELVFEDEPSIFNETAAIDLLESALQLMDDYINDNPTAISEPDFQDDMIDDVKEVFYIQFEDQINASDMVEDDMDELLEEAFTIFMKSFNIERAEDTNNMNNDTNNDKSRDIMMQRINYLRSKPQPQQRTTEWYKFRHNLITASNAYKAFESQSMVNQLIYEKCQPLKTADDNKSGGFVNVNTPFHWGQKYEPLSVMIYESMFNTKVDDFGCIQHDEYNFLGASPDGINVDETSDRFGRMLEIKNIVNREITGIPKKEYWIQTQLQMEVCGLNECDFLETKFIEFESVNEFRDDASGKQTGIIMYFNTIEGAPFYLYKPLALVNPDEVAAWEEEMMDKYQSKSCNMVWIKNCYWKLEIMSCVLITRNRKWFEDNIGQLQNVWSIIEKERVSGFQHRAPNKRVKKDLNTNTNATSLASGCWLNVKKMDGVVTNDM